MRESLAGSQRLNLLVGVAAISIIALCQSALASIPSMDISVPIIVNAQGERIREAQVGQPVEIVVSIHNDIYKEDRAHIALVEIRDQNGLTVYLAWQSAVISPDDTYTFGSSWLIPDYANARTIYSVRTFAITSFGDDVQVLSAVLESELEIVP